MARENRRNEKSRPELDVFRSPLNTRPMKGDVVEDGDLPPPMRSKDPLGYLPPENVRGEKRRGR